MMRPCKYFYYELRGHNSVTIILKNTEHHNYFIKLAESILLLAQQYLSSTGTLTNKTTLNSNEEIPPNSILNTVNFPHSIVDLDPNKLPNDNLANSSL